MYWKLFDNTRSRNSPVADFAFCICPLKIMEEETSHNSAFPGSEFLEQESKKFNYLDRISLLPDSLIHHILSFLPSTKQVVKTSVLSRRWQNLWTNVPNLIFHYCQDNPSFNGNYGEFIDRTLSLYSSSKIRKFLLQLDYPDYYEMNSRIESWILFATNREAEELSFEFCVLEDYLVIPSYSAAYLIPQFFFCSNSLTKLKTEFCDFVPEAKVDWKLLKNLHIGHAKFTDEVIKNILSGSPSLESLELHYCHGIYRLDIASKSLKRLVINRILDLTEERGDSTLEIFAPHLATLKLLGYWEKRKCKLINVSSLVNVVLDFMLRVDHGDSSDLYQNYQIFVKELLEKVCHAKQLKIGTWCLEVLSIIELQNLPSPLSTRKSLCLKMRYFEKWVLPGIASLLQSSPELDKLVMKFCYGRSLQFHFDQNFTDSYDIGEGYWTSQERTYSCLSMNLRRIEIFSLEEHLFGNKHALALVEFLIGNARVLEKMDITDEYPFSVAKKAEHLVKIAQKILTFPRSSSKAVVLFPNHMSRTQNRG